MEVFPETPQTLLKRVAELAAGSDEAVWKELIELYAPALRIFVRLTDPSLPEADVEDVVQEVFIRLVDVLRHQAYDNGRGRFRSYLAVVVRRLLVDRYRRRLARPAVDPAISPEELDAEAASPDAGTVLDVKWRFACHQAAVSRVLTQSALSARSREVYRLATVEGLSNNAIAKRLGMSAAAVRMARSRVEQMVSAIEQSLFR